MNRRCAGTPDEFLHPVIHGVGHVEIAGRIEGQSPRIAELPGCRSRAPEDFDDAVMLIKNLGPEYVVWDKSACIHFKKPGRGELHAHFLLTDEELNTIRKEIETASAAERTYQIEVTDREGNLCASVQKTIFIRKRI